MLKEYRQRNTFNFNSIQDGSGQKGPHISFSHVTSTNVGISPQNFVTFSFNPFLQCVTFQGHT